MKRNEEIIFLTILKIKGNAYGVCSQGQIYKDMGDNWFLASTYQPSDNLVRKKYVRRIKGDPTATRGDNSKFYFAVSPPGKRNLQKIKETHARIWSGIPKISLENGK
jgi:hypothetical protein